MQNKIQILHSSHALVLRIENKLENLQKMKKKYCFAVRMGWVNITMGDRKKIRKCPALSAMGEIEEIKTERLINNIHVWCKMTIVIFIAVMI